MGTVNFKLGENLGNVLLEIAQEHIINGQPEKAIETYTISFEGMDESYALQILKNKFVVETCEDGVNINLSDDAAVRAANSSNIYNWQELMDKKDTNLREMREAYCKIVNDFSRHINYPIYDANITEIVKRYWGEERLHDCGIHNIAAKLIANDDLGFKLHPSNVNMWAHLENNVECDEAEHFEYALYFIVKYVNLIRYMYKDYIKFANTYKWLLNNGFINHIPFVEANVEGVLQILNEFCNPNTGYYHPICDEKIANLKNTILDELLKTERGKEYLRYGILKKNIMDGYDAGWLSPDGTYYGGLGETSSMIHMNIADEMFKKLFDPDLLIKDKSRDGQYEILNSMFNREDPESYLMKNGWMKIHTNEIYGTFIGDKNDSDYPYCPTRKQIYTICDYVDKFHNKKFYTQAQIVRSTEPVTTYKLKQMDEIMLHNIFRV